MSIEPLPAGLVDALGRPEAYPDDPTAAAGVSTVQTHISHLFLTGARVVKLRKAVKLSFLDFSQRAERAADCQREVALNRRLAPDVYLGVAVAEPVAGGFQVRERFSDEGPALSDGAPAEPVVVMRRLEDGCDALSLLEKDALHGEHLDAVADTLARFHARVSLGCPAPWKPEEWWAHCVRPATDTLLSLERNRSDELAAHAVAALAKATSERFETLRPQLERRRVEGRAVDGHGDVHLQHIWFEQGSLRPVFIDCLEFDANLRHIDTASEVAFLAMDLSYRGRRDLAARFLRKYAAACDDFGLFDVVDAYQSYRAAVRGKVAALAAIDPRIPPEQQRGARESAQRHVALATQAICAKPPGAVVLVCGSVGVGKSTVAEDLADRTGGVVISSDRTRKHMAGIAADVHHGDAADEGLYAPEKTDAVYRALLDRAESIVSSGRVAILDATFGRAAHRALAREWAARLRVEAFLLHVQCREDLVRSRIQRRSAAGTDPSDAGPEFVAVSRRRFEPPSEWPDDHLYEKHTDREAGGNAFGALATRLGPIT